MDVRNHQIYCFDTLITDNVVAYDLNLCECLYLTDEGKTHHTNMSATPGYTSDDFVNDPDALDLYLLSGGMYILVFRNRLEVRQAGSANVRTVEVTIKPDFRLFKHFSCMRFCYINGGKLYTSWGDQVCQIPDCKFVWCVFYRVPKSRDDPISVDIIYITHDDKCEIQSCALDEAAIENLTSVLNVEEIKNGMVLARAPDETTIESLTKVLSTDVIEVYNGAFDIIIMYSRNTGYAVFGSSEFLNQDTKSSWEFNTNGYQWTIFDGQTKYYYYNDGCIEMEPGVELFNAGHYIFPSVPTKSARF